MLGGRGRIDIESYIGSDEINQMIQASSEIKNQVLTTTSNTLDMKKSCISTWSSPFSNLSERFQIGYPAL